MKKIYLILTFALIASFLLQISGCEGPMWCKDIDCGMGGFCDGTNNSCICRDGYELDSTGKCNIRGVDKFLGTWEGEEMCDICFSHYKMTFSPITSNPQQIKISNFGNFDCNVGKPLEVIATISKDSMGKYNRISHFSADCDTSFVINQTKTYIELSGNTLHFYYEVSYKTSKFTCYGNMEKL